MGLDPRDFDLPQSVTCPFCDGDDTELLAPFGSVISVVQYWCRRCHSAFEWVKHGQRR